MTETTTQQESVDLQQLAIWTAVSAVAAAVLNAILYLITAGQFDGAVAAGSPFGLGPVIGASVIQITLGGIVLAVLDRFTARPIFIWRIVAIVVLVLSLAQPFTFLEWADGVDPNGAAPIILVIMHLIAGGITIYLLTTRTQKTA